MLWWSLAVEGGLDVVLKHRLRVARCYRTQLCGLLKWIVEPVVVVFVVRLRSGGAIWLGLYQQQAGIPRLVVRVVSEIRLNGICRALGSLHVWYTSSMALRHISRAGGRNITR
jgi:hypothetical protein